CVSDFGIPLRLNCTVVKVHGRERVEGVTVADVDEHFDPKPGTERYIPCDTLLLSCGLIPENDLSRAAGIDIDPRTNGAICGEDDQTSIPGIFACGNVRKVFDLVDNVSKDAVVAGTAAAEYIRG
ncbi:MAG: FAD-dependent oxidoreductase, partial [Firmicutes bacterium]|nr:FAD-dependent oxidoreductase [Bacillota bacterium]